MNSQTKLEYYDILNSVRMMYLKSKIPFSIVNSYDIKLTYKDIKLKYINDKNYFIKVDKSRGRKEDRIPWTKEQKKEFYKQKAKEERDQPNINLDEPWTKEKRDEYRKQTEERERSRSQERKSNQKQSPQQSKKVYTADETAAYLERKKRREKSPQSRDNSHSRISERSLSPQQSKKVYTVDEIAAYLDRKKRREQAHKTGGSDPIMIFY